MTELLSKDHTILERGFMEHRPFGIDPHGENIRALIGRTPGTAELVVVSIGADGGVREVGAVATPPSR